MCDSRIDKSYCKFEDILKYSIDVEKNRDVEGKCIFHSEILKWKVQHYDIIDIYMNIQSREADSIEFSDSVFFGQDIEYILNKDVDDTSLKFTGCKILSGVTIKNVERTNWLGFNKCDFKGDLKFTNTVLSGTSLSNSSIEGTLELRNVVAKAIFGLDSIVINGRTVVNETDFQHILSIDNANLKSGGVFQMCTFRNDSTFNETTINESFLFHLNTVSGSVLFNSTNFNCTSGSITFAPVQISTCKIIESGSIVFRGNNLQKLFKNSTNVVISKNTIEGEMIFDNVDLQKVERHQKNYLIEQSLQMKSGIKIGPGCVKYFNQSKIRTVTCGFMNHNLVSDICNTFSKFFSLSTGYNLGVEIVERNESQVKYFFFSDQPISEIAFESMLEAEEKNMWALLYIGDQKINVLSHQNQNLRDKLLTGLDVIIDLSSIVLKLSARISTLKFDRAEMQSILNSASLNPSVDSIKVADIQQININQTIVWGVGNQQTLKIDKNEKA